MMNDIKRLFRNEIKNDYYITVFKFLIINAIEQHYLKCYLISKY